MDRVLLIDKPPGKTSHDIVAEVRRAVGGPRKGPGIIRVGHAGTLDPFATGLLVVLTGRATRAQSLFMGLPKT
ncbi:MAG: truB, partial [Solirubrobacterales bacterium]|nr:truB [Solirubrobacterales bacterium]